MAELLVSCNKCNVMCNPVYELSTLRSQFVCRDCALKIMEKYYDRRPDEIKETD